MVLESGLCKAVQGSFNQGNAMFGETAGIQCACMGLFAISYSTLKEVGMGLVWPWYYLNKWWRIIRF